MTQNLVFTAVEKLDRFALQEAISCFAEGALEKSAEQLTEAMMAIVGEACSLLDEGKTKEETIAYLELNGLSEECSTPFVEKAVEIVRWNQQAQEPPSNTALRLLVAGVITLLVALAVFFVGR